MKKQILLVVAVILISFTINAQDYREQLKFGIKAGINFSNVYDKDADQFTADGKLGFVGGAFLAIPLGKFLGVQPEILYSQKGFKAAGTIAGMSYTTKHTSTFIDVPLLICLKPTQGFTVMAGPQYSYLIKEKDSFSMNEVTSEDESVFHNNNIRKNILCFIGGFDFNMKNLVKVALEKMKTESFDIILMDLQMPEMNGFEATEYIRKTIHSQIPIIALTADVTTVDLKKCKEIGMNDYISKPLDERLLYTKMLTLLLEAKQNKKKMAKENSKTPTSKRAKKYVDLTYLTKRTKAKPELMIEMIALYLKQTPLLVKAMKKSLFDKNWKGLYTAVHKIIPSFAIMGMNQDFEDMAKKIQEYAGNKKELDKIEGLVLQVTTACSKACNELHKEFGSSMKNYKINEN